MNKTILYLTLAITIDGPIHAFGQNLVDNPSFEFPALPSGAHFHLDVGDLGMWQTTENKLEVWAHPTLEGYAADGSQHLEILDTASSSTVFQDIATIPGQLYAFGFYHTPRPGFDNTLIVDIGSTTVGVLDEVGNSKTEFEWQEFSFYFNAAGPTTRIAFSNLAITAAGNGSHIDAVYVVAIPESSTSMSILPIALLASLVLLSRGRR
jgi:hypothetical protein